MKKLIATMLSLACMLWVGPGPEAQAAYPYDKPINIIVPFGPGGAVDIASRILSDYFQQNYKITINVINKPGGGQAVGLNEMLHSRPDGYTMAFTAFGGPSVTTKISNVGFTHKDLKPIAQITVMEPVFATSTSSGLDTFAKFIAQAENDPANTVYATTGAITTQRLYLTKLLDRFHKGLKIRHAAYGSGHEVSTALLGKHITAGLQVPTNILPYMESGDFKAIAISRSTRRADMPDTPTFRELYADQLSAEDEKWIDLGSWHGLVTSTKVPDEHIDAFLPLLLKALQDPDVISKFNKVGLSIDYLGPKEFGEVMQISSDLVDEILAGRKTLD